VHIAAFAWLTSACTDFPTIPSGECGNGVIEAGEDCDTFGLGAGTVCRPKGADGECHLDCAVHDGTRARCPAGWGCDTDAICRQTAGDFDAPSEPADVGAWTLATGDFDGDGRADVMSLEPLDSIGATRLRFYYFDQEGQLEDTRAFPKLVISPVVADVSGDTLSDVVFSSSALGVLLGRQDRKFVPETFSSFQVPSASVRVVGVLDQRVAQISPIVPLITQATGTGFYVPDSQTGKLTLRAPFEGTVDNLVGDPVVGNLFEDARESPCLEPVLAELGASHFTVVDVCTTDSTGAITWRDTFTQRAIELEPSAPIDAAPLLVDLNGDGHLDVLVGAGGKPYASYGDGVTLSSATPYQLPFPLTGGGSADLSMPLAAGDVSGDGVPDFVFPDHLLISGQSNTGVTSYGGSAVNRLGAPWTVAKIADFNGNGKLDIVAATRGALDLQFFNGSGGPNLTANTLSTDAPVAFLAAGDFDGDFVDDIALLEMPRPGEAKSSLLIAFGTPLGIPAAASAIAQLAAPEQLAVFNEEGLGNLAATGKQTVGGTSNGTLTLLNGTSDRLPIAPYTLSEFSSNGSVEDAFAIGLAAGSFSAKDARDVLAVAITGFGDHELWLAPQIESSESVPQRLAGLDQALNPAIVGTPNFSADIGSTQADLDGDGQEDAIFAMPAGAARDQCGVLVVGAAPGSPTLVARAPVLLSEPCPDPQLLSADIDGDHFPDLALLTGSDALSNRQLIVLWNDGKGGFSSANATLVAGSAESPRSFTLLPAAPPRPFAFAYVTANAAQLVNVSDQSRQFEPARTLASLAGGTGVVAADVNGDGVVDLVLAASGKLSVLKARLVVP
jgi:FG-GAP-like repeat